jgi:hypothetical protein
VPSLGGTKKGYNEKKCFPNREEVLLLDDAHQWKTESEWITVISPSRSSGIAKAKREIVNLEGEIVRFDK